MKRFRRPGEDQGSAAVEFALVLPVLMLILFGIIDFGRMLNARITLSQAAHEGARAAAIVSEDEARATVDAVLGSMQASGVTVEGCAAGSTGDATVTVTYQFNFTTPLIGGGDGMTITSTAVVPCL